MTVTAEIDVASHTGRRILRDLEKHPRVVSLLYPLSDHVSAAGCTLDESYIKGLNKLSKHYEVEV
ncbi:MAG: hypothetical protein LBN27_10075 [Prevotellaceae bacterium]|jgi:hypothetical protein|nr:hypothetical protein [Prevotellaceae bacterium]